MRAFRRFCSSAPAVRLNKVLASEHECSRREADGWIKKGWVRVEGETAQLGQRVTEDEDLMVSRRALQRVERSVTILLHKPKGWISQSPGPRRRNQRHAIDLLIGSRHKFGGRDARDLPKMACAGRLDAESTGLLVFTQNGALARALLSNQSELEKEYLVRVEPMAAADIASGTAVAGRWRSAKPPTVAAASLSLSDDELDVDALPFEPLPATLDAAAEAKIVAQLATGLSLDGKSLKPCKVDWLEEGLLRISLTEGRYRQIRRMCAMVGLSVVSLKRVKIANATLGGLPMGKWRTVRPDEVVAPTLLGGCRAPYSYDAFGDP